MFTERKGGKAGGRREEFVRESGGEGTRGCKETREVGRKSWRKRMR